MINKNLDNDEIKKSNSVNLQKELLGSIIGLARSLQSDKQPKDTTIKTLVNALMALDSFNEDVLKIQIENIKSEKDKIIPECKFCGARCGRNDDFNVDDFLNEDEEIKNIKALIILSLKGLARYIYQAYLQGYENEEINLFMYKALFFIGYDCDFETLIPILIETGNVSRKCISILEKIQTKN